jgi:lipoprotein-anchoring transpeptidase ErfK/SrfK
LIRGIDVIKVIMAHAARLLGAGAALLPAEGSARGDLNGLKRASRVIGSRRMLSELHVQRGWPGYGETVLYIAKSFGRTVAAATIALTLGDVAFADPLALADPGGQRGLIFNHVFRDQGAIPGTTEDMRKSANVSANKRRQVVSYSTSEGPGTIVIDTSNTYLYYVVGGGRAIRYGIGVGREGFTWSGVQAVTRKAEWPDWFPPAEMLARQPYLPRVMAGGPGNPLGARAMYLGDTAYRIHGTNQPTTIGGHVSSGCIRMLNDDVIDLYTRVDVGTKVVVLPMEARRAPDQTVGNRSAPTGGFHSSSL